MEFGSESIGNQVRKIMEFIQVRKIMEIRKKKMEFR